MHTQGSFLIAAEGKRAVHKIPSSPAASTRESGKGGRLGGETLPFAAGCLNSHNADKPDLCRYGYCCRRKFSHLQRRLFGSAAHFTKPAVRTHRSGQISDGSFASLGSNNQDADFSAVRSPANSDNSRPKTLVWIFYWSADTI
jgi:hypothetical protein